MHSVWIWKVNGEICLEFAYKFYSTVICLKSKILFLVCVQERELVKYMKEYDADGDGTLDFGEFQTAMRFAQHKKNNQIHKDEVDVWE